ncbi:pyridine nucleotide-disulfide oxidoreductase domain-containing protein [Sarocladium implicatum]|nr:pyridine nucleotide-disulfide oxidoreductase domain-containing protein [Sarocladium implicatum]
MVRGPTTQQDSDWFVARLRYWPLLEQIPDPDPLYRLPAGGLIGLRQPGTDRLAWPNRKGPQRDDAFDPACTSPLLATPVRSMFLPQQAVSLLPFGLVHPAFTCPAAMSIPQVYDVLIIGGGAAGLATATGLARQLYNTVVFTDETFRNSRASHMHNFPGWDHQAPSAFRSKAKQDLLARYKTVEFENTEIVSVKKTETGQFDAVDAKGRSWVGRKLVLATGSEDQAPGIPGYSDSFGIGIYHCLFCHGYEDRGAASSGVLALGPHSGSPPMAVHLSRMARRLTENVTLYTHNNPELATEIRKLLEQDKDARSGRIRVDDRQITNLKSGSGNASSEMVMTFENGEEVTEGFLVHQPTCQVRGPFAQQLELELQPTGDIKTSSPFYETSVPGVFAVGDCATPIKAVSQAVAMGTLAAGGLAFQLGAELAQVPE